MKNLTEMQKLRFMILKRATIVCSLMTIFVLTFFTVENIDTMFFSHGSTKTVSARMIHYNSNPRHLFKDMNPTARTVHYYEANYTQPNGVTHFIYNQGDNILYLHVNAYKIKSLKHVKDSKMKPRKKHIVLKKDITYNHKAKAYNRSTVHIANENAQEIAHSTKNHQLHLIIRKDIINHK